MKKNIITEIKNKNYYLELDEQTLNNIINTNGYKKIEQIELFIQKLIIQVLNEEKQEYITINRIKLLSNYINKELTYSENLQDNINQLKKISYFYQLIKNKSDIKNINNQLTQVNPLFKQFIEFLNRNIYKINSFNTTLLFFIDTEIKIDNNKLNNEINSNQDIYDYYKTQIRSIESITPKQRYELLIKAKNGDELSYKKFIESNLKLVISVALNYKSSADLNDLIQSGNIGLIEAFNKFDLNLGFSFSTYAIYWIKREILLYLNKNHIIQYPINDYPFINKIKKAENILSNLKKALSDKNISEITGIPISKVKRIRSIPLQVESLDIPVIEGEDETALINLVKSNDNIEEEYIEKDTLEQIHIILKNMIEKKFLNEREAQILLMKTGFINNRTYTYDEIGEKYNLTRQRIEQIYKQILKKIRNSKYYKLLADIYSVNEINPKIKNKKI